MGRVFAAGGHGSTLIAALSWFLGIVEDWQRAASTIKSPAHTPPTPGGILGMKQRSRPSLFQPFLPFFTCALQGYGGLLLRYGAPVLAHRRAQNRRSTHSLQKRET